MWGFGAPRCLHPKGQFCLYANKASMMQFKTEPSTPHHQQNTGFKKIGLTPKERCSDPEHQQ